MLKKAIVLLLAVSLVIGTAAGCRGRTDQDANKKNEIVVNVGSEPKTIDPTLNNAVDGAIYIIHAFEGLMKLDKEGQVQPGIAERYEMSDDGTVFTFYLRDAKWSDGKPVKAQDFVYSWKRALDPAVGAEYSYQLYYIKNGAAINSGDKPLDELGARAINDKTLEVTLEAPTAYFLELTTFPTLFPLREDIVSKDQEGWSTKPKTYIGNGPFVLKEWNHDSEIIMVKNKNYYAADTIKPTSIRFALMGDPNAILASFKNGELLLAEDVPPAEIPKLQEEGVLRIDPQLGTYFYCYNTEKPPFDDSRVRMALSLAIDRQYIVENVTKGNQIPAGAYVPSGIPDVNAKPDFRETGGNYYDPMTSAYQQNVAKAKQLLAEAGYPDGQGFPQVELMYNTEGAHLAIAEAVQEMWKQNLGITVKLSGQEWAVFQDTRTRGNFQIARHGWLGDYVDPMTFLDMWMSNSGQNDANWKNTEYDKLIEIARSSNNREERMEAMHKAEDLFMADAVVAPVYFYSDIYLISDKLKGFYASPLGFKYFMFCTVDDNAG